MLLREIPGTSTCKRPILRLTELDSGAATSAMLDTVPRKRRIRCLLASASESVDSSSDADVHQIARVSFDVESLAVSSGSTGEDLPMADKGGGADCAREPSAKARSVVAAASLIAAIPLR